MWEWAANKAFLRAEKLVLQQAWAGIITTRGLLESGFHYHEQILTTSCHPRFKGRDLPGHSPVP